MRMLFIILVLCACSNKLVLEKQVTYSIPAGLSKRDSIDLARGYDDLNEMKKFSKHKK